MFKTLVRSPVAVGFSIFVGQNSSTQGGRRSVLFKNQYAQALYARTAAKRTTANDNARRDKYSFPNPSVLN